MKITNKFFFAHLLFSLIVCYVRNHQNQAMKPMGVLPIVDTETFGSCIALWRINVVMRSFWAAGMTVLKPRTCRMEMARLEDGSIPITEIARRNQQGLQQAGKVARVDEGAEADSMLLWNDETQTFPFLLEKKRFLERAHRYKKDQNVQKFPTFQTVPIHAQGAQVSLDQRAQTSLHLSKALLFIC